MTRFLWRSLAVAAALPCVAVAQDRVSPESFLDFAVGKTLTFEVFPNGNLVGFEEYLRRDLSVWRDRSDICVYGRVTVEDNLICFLYDNDREGVPVCWATFRDNNRWFVMSTRDGESEIQEVTEASDEGLSCPVKPGV